MKENNNDEKRQKNEIKNEKQDQNEDPRLGRREKIVKHLFS
jgi:hypothetical protein